MLTYIAGPIGASVGVAVGKKIWENADERKE
jgi:hypothetical protein